MTLSGIITRTEIEEFKRKIEIIKTKHGLNFERELHEITMSRDECEGNRRFKIIMELLRDCELKPQKMEAPMKQN